MTKKKCEFYGCQKEAKGTLVEFYHAGGQPIGWFLACEEHATPPMAHDARPEYFFPGTFVDKNDYKKALSFFEM